MPDHHPTHHFDHPCKRQIIGVDPLLNVREGAQDGVFRVPDQGSQLLIRGRDGAGAEPPVTHIMWCPHAMTRPSSIYADLATGAALAPLADLTRCFPVGSV